MNYRPSDAKVAGGGMDNSVSHALVDAFFAAYATRDSVQIAPFLDENVEWAVTGPIDLLPFCGEHNGKQAVMALFDNSVPAVFDDLRAVRDQTLIDGDRVAVLIRLFATQRGSGRPVSYRTAQFYRFRAGKIVTFRAVFDSFNAAEQVHGQPFQTANSAERGDVVVL
jgi:ketosteroid isomerase-like protein